ncbi:hypothetical protein COLO4_06513 [Corchorus olitorius]|uniref:Uncharacterized protein n=1 Tax=Corchorus olitorius TaxID=93759 RepID=A0A1R3KMW3_9ROSI|nr:hypothetical protein COLO4_06513 [Corchorus olitorius]
MEKKIGCRSPIKTLTKAARSNESSNHWRPIGDRPQDIIMTSET